jgi:diguanylate cyclase (GGDEF)-like protein
MMGLGLRTDIASRPWRLSAKLLIASSVVTVIGFSAICAGVMLDMHRSEEGLANQTLENLASSIDSDIGRSVELYDLSLRAVATNMVAPEINEVGKSLRQLILFDHAASARYFGAIQVFDAAGKLIADASTLDPLPEDRSDEEYFRAHREQPDVGLFVSRPMLHHGTYAIVLSRRITGEDGRFFGVVAGSIRFSFFHDLFGRLHLAPDDVITVLRRDGVVIMRTPFDLDIIGQNLGDLPGVKQALSEPSGSYSGVIPPNPSSRLHVWRDSTRPLIVLVSKRWSDIYELWRKEATRIGAIVAMLVAFVLGVTLFLAREIGRRADAEEKLEELATTDSLTGLRNRRKFDAVIETEWRRAIRQRQPLALLMIDADYFKSFNDTHGHQAGDEVLVGIAICISDSVRRAGDCAARYGGEEFAVLLPDMLPKQAFMVAETIRLKVEQWCGETATTTVSIGVASMIPEADTDWAEIVKRADRALYAAKEGGRNRSVLSGPSKLSLVA